MKMWKIWMVVVAVLPTMAVAQVEKQVEVTKTYLPTLEQAKKLTIVPDMTDTMQLRPEIDYTITPLTMQTSLTTRPIRPAQISYWEFNRPQTYYLKAGLGAPLQSVLDLYASTQQPSYGYALGYLNHEGRYSKIKNDFGVKNPSTRLLNRIGTAAGRYVGKRLLEGNVQYDHRLYRRYGAFYPVSYDQPSDKVGYSTLDAAIRIGDEFQDLTRTNFEVRLDGSLFFDHTEPILINEKGGENRLSAEAKVARMFDSRRLMLGVGYHRLGGSKALEKMTQQQVTATARYATEQPKMRFEVGLDYCYDRLKGERQEREHYLFPYAHFEFDLIADAVKPFAEIDGGVSGNDYRSLSEENPYLGAPMWLDRSTAEWAGRAGLTGHSKNNRFYYRAFAAFTLRDNQRYWLLPALNVEAPTAYAAGWMIPYLGRQSCFSLGGELAYRPLSSLRIDGSAAFYAYNNDEPFEHGRPAMEGEVGIRYEGRKVCVGVRAVMVGERSWSVVDPAAVDQPQNEMELAHYDLPFALDLQVDFEWKIRPQTALFVEGRNLLGSDCYLLPTLPEYGIHALLGIRKAF